MNKAKIFELKIEEDDELSGIDSISLVDEPAIEINWVAFNKVKAEEFVIPDGDDLKYSEMVTQKGQSEEELLNDGWEVVKQEFVSSSPNAESIEDTNEYLIRYKYIKNPEAPGADIKETTRDFCVNVLLKNFVYRVEDLDSIVNDQGSSAMVWRGGYNCRHIWQQITYRRDAKIVNKGSVTKGRVDDLESLDVLGLPQPDTRTSNPSFSKQKFEVGVPHYTKDGKLYEGPTHKDADGRLMTGAVHTKDSEYLYHQDELAEIGPRGGIKESPKAPKSDTKNTDPKGKGSAEGDASGKSAKVTAEQEKTLQKKVDDFNEKESNTKNGNATLGQLKSVFQRGLGAFNTSHSPVVKSAEQWAYARVNAYLYLLKNGRPENPKYDSDYDLLPKKHPKAQMSSEEIIVCKECGHEWSIEDGGVDVYICHVCGYDNSPMKTNNFKSYSDYPDSVKNNAKAVLKWVDENGWGSCGTDVGKQRANQLAKGEPISEETIKRMYSYLSRHEVDLDSSKGYGDGCGKLMYDSWGGKTALSWAESKVKQFAKEEFAGEKVSMDYDDTLSTDRGKLLAKRLLAEGKDLHIITRRREEMLGPVKLVAKQLGIPESKVHATNGKLKWETIKRMGIQTHYDNNPDELKAIQIHAPAVRAIKFDYDNSLPSYVDEVPTGKTNNFIEQFEYLFTQQTNSKQHFQTDAEKRIVLGPAMIPDMKIFRKDKNGEPYYVFFSADTIKMIAEKYMKNKYLDNNDMMHDGQAVPDVYVTESWIKEDDNDKSVKYGYGELPIGTWFVAMKVKNDEIWSKVKDHQLNGFSVSGFFEEVAAFHREEAFLKELAEILKKIK